MSEMSAPAAAAAAASGEATAHSHSQHKAVRRLSPAASSTKESSILSKESDRSLGEPVFVVSKSGPSWIHGRDLGFATTKSTSSERSLRGLDRSTILDDGVDSCTADTENTIDRSGVDYWRHNHNSPHKMTSGSQRTSHDRQTDMDSDQDSNASVASWPLLPDEKRRSQLRLSTMIMIEPEKSHSGLKEKALASARNSLTGDPWGGMGFSGFLPPCQPPRDQTPVEELLGSKEFPFPPYTEVGAASEPGEGREERDWQSSDAQQQAVAFDDINFGPGEDWPAVRSSSAGGDRGKQPLPGIDKMDADVKKDAQAHRMETSATNTRSWSRARTASAHHARPLVLPQVTATSEARKRSKRSTNIFPSSSFLKHAPLEGSTRLCHEFIDSTPGLPVRQARVPSPAQSLVAAGGDDWLEQTSTSSEDDSMHDEDLIDAPIEEPEIVQVKTVKKSISRAEALLFVGRSPVSETRHFQEAGVQTTATGKGPEALLDNGRRRPRPQLTITIDNRAPANSPKRQVWHATCPACGHDIHLDAPYVSDPASALSATPTPPLSAKMLAQARVDARAAQRAPAAELYQQQFEQLQSAVDDVQTSPSWRASQQSGRSRSTLSSSASGVDSGRSKWSLEESNRPARVLALVDRCATSGRSSTSDSEHRASVSGKSNIVSVLFKSKLSEAPTAMVQGQRSEGGAATTHVAERPSSRASSIASSLAAFSIGSRRTDLASRGSTSCSGGPTSALIESYACDSGICDAEVAVESISSIPSMSQPAFRRPQASSVSATSSAERRAGSESLPSTPGPLCVQHELPSSFDTETQVTNEVCPWEDDIVTPHRTRLSDSFDAPLPRTPASNAKALKLLGIGSGAAADIAMIASANDGLARRTSISHISTPYEAAHIGGSSALSESQFIGGVHKRTHAARNSSTTDLTTTVAENATLRRIQSPKSSTALTTQFQGHGGSAMGDIQQSMGKLKSALKKTSKLAVPSSRQGLRSGSSSSLNSANGPAGGSSGSGAGSASGSFNMQSGDSGISGPLHSMKMPLAITENGLQVGAEALAFRLPSLDLANDARPTPNTSVSSNFPMRGTADTAVEDNSSNWGVLMQTNEYFTTTTASPPSRTAKDLPPYPGLESSNDDQDMWLSGTRPDETIPSSSMVESEWQNPHPYASSAHVNSRVPAGSQDLASIWSATTQPLPRQKWE